jgi:hypothetical protein
MKLRPLEQFFCDECRDIINSVGDGWLEWKKDDNLKGYGFRIVHAVKASPKRSKGGNCSYQEKKGEVSDLPLDNVAGIDGLIRLLSFLDEKQHEVDLKDPTEIVEIIRRIHVPHYEEARSYIQRAYDEDFIDSTICTEEQLIKIIEKYSEAKI